jgi:hypothetical protein
VDRKSPVGVSHVGTPEEVAVASVLVESEAALGAMPIGSSLWWDGSTEGETLEVVRHEDPEGPWWEVRVHDDTGSVARTYERDTPGDVLDLVWGAL